MTLSPEPLGPEPLAPEPLAPEQYYAQIEAATAAIAALVEDGELAQAIPTCPDWTLRELAIHVGRAHRWAAAITGTRSAESVPFRSLPDGRFPDDPAERAPWLTAGARRACCSSCSGGRPPATRPSPCSGTAR